jgi:hypothetical protein
MFLRAILMAVVLPERVGSGLLITEARRRKLAVLLLATNPEEGRRLNPAGVDGVVLEGDFADGFDGRGFEHAIRLPLRDHLQFRANAPAIGTSQGLWPGLQIEHNGKVLAGPSSQPWVFTNTGFPQFARRISAREPAALAGWKTIAAAAGYFENRQWRGYEPYATLALVRDKNSGGLLSGGLLDMMSSQHTRSVRLRRHGSIRRSCKLCG